MELLGEIFLTTSSFTLNLSRSFASDSYTLSTLIRAALTGYEGSNDLSTRIADASEEYTYSSYFRLDRKLIVPVLPPSIVLAPFILEFRSPIIVPPRKSVISPSVISILSQC